MIYPPKPGPGDRVAILSPSAGLPGLFPDVYELGRRRLRERYGVEPVEYPTTRRMDAAPADRARDLHAAFADPKITAVLASIGGSDQITVLRHLDADLIRENPKPFFGYSDNTNFLHYLYGLGVVGYHGGSVMVHLGRPGRLHPAHETSLHTALFGAGWHDLTPPTEWTDEHRDWADVPSLAVETSMHTSAGWRWHNADQVVEGRSWGGNIEIVSWLLQAGLVAPSESYAGGVLFLETSEEMPAPEEVFRILRNMGERRLLEQFPAVLVGRPKAWDREHGARVGYADGVYAAFERALATYNPSAIVDFDLDIGHTDPQLIVPYGGMIRVDGPAARISCQY
jgi:muramoyltetrapeptide carboxypeptidase LdcA involved in peptidoglycan recycling